METGTLPRNVQQRILQLLQGQLDGVESAGPEAAPASDQGQAGPRAAHPDPQGAVHQHASPTASPAATLRLQWHSPAVAVADGLLGQQANKVTMQWETLHILLAA